MITKFAASAKAWFGAVVAGVSVLDVALLDGTLTGAELARTVTATVLALGVVYNVSNAPSATELVTEVPGTLCDSG